jgi:hypothetical protein
MDPLKLRQKTEAEIQEALISYLRTREWLVKPTHGNAYQAGFPDLYAVHKKFGCRWIEVKNPFQFSFTDAQMTDFPLLYAHGAPLYVLCDASLEEYEKLWKPRNFMDYYLAHTSGYHNIYKWWGDARANKKD